ncbi:MAG: DNA topoisomerase VI subunit B [Candidatus Aenigmarchaeota archaeon ex4484_52]|nr:MAG: DNA topoisomerase VI subunit B [Candidatus Aenigmarchaeota archaeon ex4484_52]
MEKIQTRADELAKEHKEISVAEFFEKNKHLLGYENLQKSLLTCVREAVDNALDACEEMNVLPDIYIEIKKIKENRFKLIVEDNGPGIVKEHIANIFGKLLYGSKFHKLQQSRGQQGIGISASVLYSQLTTGKDTKIYSKIGDGKVHIYELHIDTKTNNPVIAKETTIYGNGRGTRIEMELKGKYMKGKRSVYDYLQQTAIMNPASKIVFIDPNSKKYLFDRVVNKLAKRPKEIRPHLAGIEHGTLKKMLKLTKARNIVSFITTEFSRIGKTTALEIVKKAEVDEKLSPKNLSFGEIEKIIDSVEKTKLSNPPTDCLSPVGELQIEKGIKKELHPEFVATITRKPSVYRGNPFQIEFGIGYGGDLDKEGQSILMRFANKVPLLYEQSSCALTKAIMQTDWKRYGLSQTGSSIPTGPVIFAIHIVSVWVPYTSEGKEAVASYPDIIKEVKLALCDVGRKLLVYLSRKKRAAELEEKKETFKKYISRVATSLAEITGKDKNEIEEKLKTELEERIELIEVETEKYEDLEINNKIKEEEE